MNRKWIWLGCLFILLSFFLIGWVFPIEKGKETFLGGVARKSELSNEDEYPFTKQAPALSGYIAELENGQPIVVTKDREHSEVNGYVTLTEKTKIYQRVQGKLVEASEKDLRKNQKIQVWCDGPIIMIYPMRITADYLVFEEEIN